MSSLLIYYIVVGTDTDDKDKVCGFQCISSVLRHSFALLEQFLKVRSKQNGRAALWHVGRVTGFKWKLPGPRLLSWERAAILGLVSFALLCGYGLRQQNVDLLLIMK